MKVVLITGSILLPLLMAYAQNRLVVLQRVFNIAAFISLLVFGNIIAVTIYQIIINHTVFMTNVHAVFLNPFFLITAIYLGLYTVYLLILLSKKAW